MDSNQLVTITAFDQEIPAQMAMLKLQQQDIECCLENNNIVAINWLYSNAVGGIKLQVRAKDAQKAVEVLRQQEPKLQNPLSEERCPQCNSDNIYNEPFSRKIAFLSLLLLGWPLPWTKRKWKCNACGHQWK